MSTARSGFNEYNIRETSVNGKTLHEHRGFDADDSATARRLLAYNDAIARVNVGRHSMDVYFRYDDIVGWGAPEGYRIESVSAFHDADEWRESQTTIVRIRRGNDE